MDKKFAYFWNGEFREVAEVTELVEVVIEYKVNDESLKSVKQLQEPKAGLVSRKAKPCDMNPS